jgi:hypothetical protein
MQTLKDRQVSILNHIEDALIKFIKSISIKLYVLPYTLNVAQEAEQSIILVAKSQIVDLAGEWSNYRLACARINSVIAILTIYSDFPRSKPSGFAGIGERADLFITRLSAEFLLATATIERQGLDDPGNREIVSDHHFQNYFERGYPEDYLRSYSPFVWSEAKRQGRIRIQMKIQSVSR